MRDCWRYNELVAEGWSVSRGSVDAHPVVQKARISLRGARDRIFCTSGCRRTPILKRRMGWPGDRVTKRATVRCRGRSGLHRTRWWATPTRGNPRDQCHRKQTATALRSGGKGETVVQETTSAAGNRRG